MGAGQSGPIGPMGATGSMGATGPPGAAGSPGATGTTGVQGPMGPIGPVGPSGGPPGPVGPTGVPGATGPPGVAGIQGQTGAPGPIGKTGPVGPAGTFLANGDYVLGKIQSTTLHVNNSNVPINSQGAWLQWNRGGGDGRTYLVNQQGMGVGGISFGKSDLLNQYTELANLDSAGNLNVTGKIGGTKAFTGGACMTGALNLWEPLNTTFNGATCDGGPGLGNVICPAGTTKQVLFKLNNANRGGEGALCV